MGRGRRLILNDELEKFRRKRFRYILWYYPSIYPEGFKKITKNLRIASLRQGIKMKASGLEIKNYNHWMEMKCYLHTPTIFTPWRLWGPKDHSGHDEKNSHSSSIHSDPSISILRLSEFKQVFVFQMPYVSKPHTSIKCQMKLSLEEWNIWKLKQVVAVRENQCTYCRDRKSRFNTTFLATEHQR
jgi:hypothetical protein